mgnify:CR=1 FL=1
MPDNSATHESPEFTPRADEFAADASNVSDSEHDETRQRIRRLPPEVGAVLITVGVVGVIIPGPIGTPFLLAGGLALMPGFFGRFERWIEKRLPRLHGAGMRNVDRFIDSFEKRFPPNSTGADPEI